jgi:mono/diheme cytochrome c family protein
MRHVIAGASKAAGALALLVVGSVAANAQDMDALLEDGEDIFGTFCAVCHGGEGGGSEGARLVGNQLINSISLIMDQVIRGGAYMPAFGPRLSDDDIAAVATFIRNSWGNEFGVVTAEQVAGYR